jgi:demethylmenaquinone methyltransferase/2-methoxy-6-polyprenyl-1,4-benzoquinol methylase
MFGRVARRYDLLNHVLSANLDRGWRRAAARALDARPAERVLDLCGGTGDLTAQILRSGRARSVVCCDFSRPMLERAEVKLSRSVPGRYMLVEADGLRLPFPDAAFGAVTVAFGVRNLADLDAGLREMRRVIAPGGRLVVLEFSAPTAPVISWLYRTYRDKILPRVGDGVSGADGAYGYLARTIAAFPDAAALAERVRQAGFSRCEWVGLSGGIVAVHTGNKG